MASGTRRVLHVEDDELNRSLMSHVVALVPGWSVVAAATLAEARSALADAASGGRPFDLVLVDLDLPDGRGDDLLADLGTNTAAWAVTGDATPATEARLLAAGIARVLVKPFEIAGVTAALEDWA